MSRAVPNRSWCFTLNNPDGIGDAEPVSFNDRIVSDRLKAAKAVYFVYQLERGSAGTLHLQGYVRFKSTVHLSGVRKVLPGAHWEPRKGTEAQARDYCMKDPRLDGPWEFGTHVSQGSRSDLLAVKDLIDDGIAMVDIADSHFVPFIKFHRGLQVYANLKRKRGGIRPAPVISVYWSTASGVGKSRKAFEDNPDAYPLRRPNSSALWWDAYDGEDTVIIDEFYGWMPYDFLIRMLDRYPLLVDTKCGAVFMMAHKFVFTSNKHPKDWYKDSIPYYKLERRLSEFGSITCFDPVHDGSIEPCVHGAMKELCPWPICH